MKRILILVEGQTEERFVKQVLRPHLAALSVVVIPTLVVTKIVKNGPNFKGGVTTYDQVRQNLRALLKDSDAALVTTLIDLYGLPADVPGLSVSANLRGAARARAVTQAISEDFGSPSRLAPFLMVHEFEALLFCNTAETARVLANGRAANALNTECHPFASPEDINDGPGTAPSKRVLRHFPNYQKPVHGPEIALSVGLLSIRNQCPHFGEWLGTLEGV